MSAPIEADGGKASALAELLAEARAEGYVVVVLPEDYAVLDEADPDLIRQLWEAVRQGRDRWPADETILRVLTIERGGE